MLTFIIVLILVMGVNTTLWGLVGLVRVINQRMRRGSPRTAVEQLEAGDIAVLIAAHNEELVIADTIRSAAALVPLENIFVASDASTDATARVAREHGINVVELTPNRGKAGALTAAIEHFQLTDSFQVVMLLDADTQLAPDYLDTGLPFFDDPQVVAVAGRATTIFKRESRSRLGQFIVAYRERFYVSIQYLLKLGQAARNVNVVSIVPGFASMYRTRILSDIDISAPGLAIEDFNMTFEVHAKRLGRIAFHPRAAVAYTQDPDTFQDYTRQLQRWTLGFWQTVRRHGFHMGAFWGALTLYIMELITSSIMMILFLPLLVLSGSATIWMEITDDRFGTAAAIVQTIPLWTVVLGVLLPDYLLTIFVVIVTRRARYLLLGFGFPFMRVVDAIICLGAIPQAFLGRSNGMWKSPVRRLVARSGPELPRSKAITKSKVITE